MQIRHSYSIGSIVPFTSSTTFTTTDKTKTAANARISYRPGLHFLTCKYNFLESHWNAEIFNIWVFQTKHCKLCAFRMDGSFRSLRSWCPLRSTTAEHSSFLLYTICNDGNHSSLILTVSPTSNTLTAVKIQPLACTGALREWTTGYRLS